MLSTGQNSLDGFRYPPGSKGWLRYSHALAGRKDKAIAILDELTLLSKTIPIPLFQFFLLHLGLGRFEQALDWLEKAIDERAGGFLPYIRQEGMFDPLRGSPRFEALVRRLNFPSN